MILLSDEMRSRMWGVFLSHGSSRRLALPACTCVGNTPFRFNNHNQGAADTINSMQMQVLNDEGKDGDCGKEVISMMPDVYFGDYGRHTSGIGKSQIE